MNQEILDQLELAKKAINKAQGHLARLEYLVKQESKDD